MEPSMDDVIKSLAGINSHIHSLRDQISSSKQQELLRRAMAAVNGVPTAGELLMFLLRRQIAMRALKLSLDTAVMHVFARLNKAFLQAFLTPERLSCFSEKTRQELKNLDEWIPADGLYVATGIDTYIIDIDDAGLRDKLWREYTTQRTEQVSTPGTAEARKIVSDLVRQALLDAVDQEELNCVMACASTRVYAYSDFFLVESEATQKIIKDLGIEYGLRVVADPENRSFDFESALKYLSAHPDARIETVFERNLRHNGSQALTEAARRGGEWSEDFLLLHWGELYDLGNENVLVREAVFRFVVDGLGIDPRQPAAMVTERIVTYGGLARPGHYYLYPDAQNTNVVYVIGIGKMHDPPAHIRVMTGGLETVKNRLAERTDGVSNDFNELRRLRKTLVPATVDPNPFHRMRYPFENIEAHFLIRSSLAKALKHS